MDVREFYRAVGGAYDEVYKRVPSDELIRSFLLRFPSETSYAKLMEARADGDAAGAFRAAHALCGVASTLGLLRLSDAAAALTKALRAQESLPEEKLFEAVSAEYARTAGLIKCL